MACSGVNSLRFDPYGAGRWLVNGMVAAFALGLVPGSDSVAAAEVRLLALGDSLTAGYGLDAADSFTAQLERALNERGLDVRVINAGVSGDTSAGGRSRLDWALAEKPGVAMVELGANDGLRGLDPQSTYQNLDAILARLKQAAVPVLLAGMKAPPNLGAEYGREFETVYRRLAEKYDVVFYPFFLDGVAAQPALNQGDQIHPNARGVAVIVDRLLPHVMRLLASRN